MERIQASLSRTKRTRRYGRGLQDKQVSEGNYYLVVGRFVPENNYEAMIRGFMQSNSQKDFCSDYQCRTKQVL